VNSCIWFCAVDDSTINIVLCIIIMTIIVIVRDVQDNNF